MIGYSASAWRRVAVGGVFCLAAAALVWAVERGPSALEASVAEPDPVSIRRLPLVIESTVPVTGWQVQVLRVPQTPSAADAWSWHGEVTVPAGEFVLIRAESTREAHAPHRALRVRLGDAPESLHWSDADQVVAVEAP